MMMSGFVIFLILLVIFVPVALVVVFTLAITGTIRTRRETWVAVRPQGERPVLEQLPPGVRMVLATVGPPLADAGFVEAERYYADRFASNTSWTQVLFVNRATGERASVIGMREGETDYVDVMLGSEVPVAGTVSTGFAHDSWMSLAQPLNCDVHGLLARHRTAVAQAVAVGADSGREAPVSRMRPAAGEEFRWLEERAADVAADAAKKLRLYTRSNGDVYRMTWFAAFIAAANRRIGGGTRKTRRGFDLLLPDRRALQKVDPPQHLTTLEGTQL